MSRNKSLFSLAVFLLLLSACTPEAAPEPTLTPTPPPTATDTPTPTATPAPTPPPTTPPDISRLTYDCIETIDFIPSNVNFEGSIALYGMDPNIEDHLLNLQTGEKHTLGSIAWPSMWVSPDRTMLSYIDFELEVLVILDSNMKQLKVIPNPENRLMPVQWLDNNRLVVSNRGENGYPDNLNSIVILNPFTNERQEFLPDFPNINDWGVIYRVGGGWGSYSTSRVVVNPALTHLVYPTLDQELILWDIDSQREITRIIQLLTSGGIDGGVPWWSPNGTKFITSFAPRYFDKTENKTYYNVDDGLPYVGGFDLFSVNQTGEIERLSYLTTTYDAVESSFVWSPDGRKIAFWLRIIENQAYSDSVQQLAVLDVETGEVTNYCISGYDEPIWSPDGMYLAVNVWPEPDDIPYEPIVLLVDMKEGFAVKIAEKVEIAGWMINMP